MNNLKRLKCKIKAGDMELFETKKAIASKMVYILIEDGLILFTEQDDKGKRT
jgi:hypothetical protein